MRAVIVTLEDGSKVKVWARAWYQNKSGRELFDMKQKAAEEQRAKGREELARAIESKPWIKWINDSGIISQMERIQEPSPDPEGAES